MGRWEPDARDRLERAALELFLERGFDGTTVPQIAARAGLTTRTFFRHFVDKREVLFSGEDEIPALAAGLVIRAPADLEPMDVIRWGLPTMTALFQDRADHLRSRRRVIDGNDALREREYRKLASLSDSISSGFRVRGVDDLHAVVAAETAVIVFKVALRRWLDTDGDLTAVVGETLHVLTTVTHPSA